MVLVELRPRVNSVNDVWIISPWPTTPEEYDELVAELQGPQWFFGLNRTSPGKRLASRTNFQSGGQHLEHSTAEPINWQESGF